MVGTPDPPDPGIATATTPSATPDSTTATTTANTTASTTTFNNNNQPSYAEVAALATAPSTEVLQLINAIEQQLTQEDSSYNDIVQQYINHLTTTQWHAMLQRASEIPAKFLLDCIYTIQTNNWMMLHSRQKSIMLK